MNWKRARRADASVAIRLIIGGELGYKPIRASLKELNVFKSLPIYTEYRAATDVVLEQVSQSNRRFDQALVASAARTIASICESNRMISYLSVPIGIAETLTYGGPWIGLSIGLVALSAQATLDAKKEPRWIARLRDL